MPTEKKNKTQPPRSISAAIARFLLWLLIIAGLCVCWLNIQPYGKLSEKVFESTSGGTDIVQMILAIPVIGWLLQKIGIAIHILIGFVFWAIIQLTELFPIVLRRDRRFARTLINEHNSSDKFNISESDEPSIQALKRVYNRFPTLTLQTAVNTALLMYTLDFVICGLTYPPCLGGLGEFFYILATAQFSRIIWRNLILLGIALFALEGIFRGVLWLGEVIYFMRISRQ
jgi:hypothetical protein